MGTIVIRQQQNGRFTVSLGVYGRTENLPGSHATTELAEQHAARILAARDSAVADVVYAPAGTNAGDLLRRQKCDAFVARFNTALPNTYGHVVAVTLTWAQRNDLLSLGYTAAVIGHCPMTIRGESLDGPRIITVVEPVAGAPALGRVTSNGVRLAAIAASIPAEHWTVSPVTAVLCGGMHARTPGPEHRVHRDCPWCGGIGYAISGHPESPRVRVCDVGGSCSPRCDGVVR